MLITPPATVLAASIALLVAADLVSALSHYGHAFPNPRADDFTPSQYAAIASTFPVFTVEKGSATGVYGNSTAAKPYSSNSIAATKGIAQKIKALNSSVKVLMYWNNALHYNMYECEAAVPDCSGATPGCVSWTYTSPTPGWQGKPPLWNYSVPAFRQWWVDCAVTAVTQSGGAIDGLFLDGTPKLEAADAVVEHWGAMVDQLRSRLPPQALVMDNGFYMSASGAEDAGEDAWNHTGVCYIESLANIGPATPPAEALKHMSWIRNESAKHPTRTLIGHGSVSSVDEFEFGMAKYMLLTASVRHGWFLGNTNYAIDGGLLRQPATVYAAAESCGEPSAPFATRSPTVLTRQFEHGTVEVNLGSMSGTISCGGVSA